MKRRTRHGRRRDQAGRGDRREARRAARQGARPRGGAPEGLHGGEAETDPDGAGPVDGPGQGHGAPAPAHPGALRARHPRRANGALRADHRGAGTRGRRGDGPRAPRGRGALPRRDRREDPGHHLPVGPSRGIGPLRRARPGAGAERRGALVDHRHAHPAELRRRPAHAARLPVGAGARGHPGAAAAAADPRDPDRSRSAPRR